MDDSSEVFPADVESPPRNEREYLANRIKELERANRRWKVGILAAIAAAVLFLLFTAGFVLFRARVQQARMQAEQARWQAEQRLQQFEAAKPRPRR